MIDNVDQIASALSEFMHSYGVLLSLHWLLWHQSLLSQELSINLLYRHRAHHCGADSVHFFLRIFGSENYF